MKISFLWTKKKFPPKDIFSLLSNTKYHQNHVSRLQTGRQILSWDCCLIWLGLTSPGGLDATIVEKMSEDVQQGLRAKRKKGGKYCVAGTVNGISCKNVSYTPNVSVHKFPADPATRNAWVKLVRKHRLHFTPSGSSVLCSAHFEECCFTRMSGVVPEDSSPKQIRNLHKGSVPTRDTTSLTVNDESSARQRRQVSKAIFFANVITSLTILLSC